MPSLPTFNSSIDDLYPKKPVAAYTYKGFVSNFTASRDACLQPHLRGMHGTFIESISMSTLHDLFPMFGGYKLEQNNEIVIPAGMYLTDREFYSGGKGIGGAVSAPRRATTPRPYFRRKRACVLQLPLTSIFLCSSGRRRRTHWSGAESRAAGATKRIAGKALFAFSHLPWRGSRPDFRPLNTVYC